MHRPLIIANWKMNTSLSDAIILATTVKNAVSNIDAEIVLCPPFVWLYPLAEALEKAPSNLKLGAQNMWFTEKGPITGEISPLMVKSLAKYVILGHSERRLHFCETNELINDKLLTALKHDLKPVLCVGELKKSDAQKRGRGRPTFSDVKFDLFYQLEKALKGIDKDEIEKIIICYEPVWAISKGTAESRNPASGSYANSIIAKIREAVAKKYGQNSAERINVVYGGSVDEDNIKEFIYQPEIDGVLVGGASLKAKEFVKICQEAAGRE